MMPNAGEDVFVECLNIFTQQNQNFLYFPYAKIVPSFDVRMIFPGTKCDVFPGAIGILLQLELTKITNLQIVLLHAIKISSIAVII